MALRISFFFLFISLHSSTIEFYADWSWNAEGTKIFTPTLSKKEENWPVLWKIQTRLKEKGWDIKCWDYNFYQPLLKKGDFTAWNEWSRKNDLSANLWVFWNMGGRLKNFDLSRVPKEQLVLFMWEPPTVELSLYTTAVQDLFGKIFTWDDDLVDNQKFFKFHYPALKKRISKIPKFDEKKLCVMINTFLVDKHPQGLYGERVAAALFFEEKEGEFDLYGRFWSPEKFLNWKGTVKDKATTLANYKFCICYENMQGVKGYITEKIFDCFMAGCVPIYWGASNVNDYIPPDCFIDRREFASTEEVYEFIKKMGLEEYEGYLIRAADFLKSEKAQVFSRDAFVDLFILHLARRDPRSCAALF